jgi:hypothetical protein
VFSLVSDSERRVLQIPDWVGGGGTKPVTGQYVGATGLTGTAASAIDIRGAAGASVAGKVAAIYRQRYDATLAATQQMGIAWADVPGSIITWTPASQQNDYLYRMDFFVTPLATSSTAADRSAYGTCRLVLDGLAVSRSERSFGPGANGQPVAVHYVYLLAAQTQSAHTVKLQLRTNGTASGANAAYRNLRPHHVRNVIIGEGATILSTLQPVDPSCTLFEMLP